MQNPQTMHEEMGVLANVEERLYSDVGEKASVVIRGGSLICFLDLNAY